MTLNAQIFAYCERGQNPSFWAEPFNALTNAGFLVAALIGWRAWRACAPADRGAIEAMLIGLVALIGVGSFLFHTFATRWAAIADAAPIGLFMLAYTGFALRRFLAAPWWAAAAGIAAFVALMAAAFAAPCPLALRGIAGGGRCLNGSIGYVPALGMLAVVGLGAAWQRHRAARYLLAAAVVFAGSLLARTFDIEWCQATQVFGAARGTHGFWHLLNATTLGLLLLAAVHRPRGAAGAGG
jgi:hypothetical protein